MKKLLYTIEIYSVEEPKLQDDGSIRLHDQLASIVKFHDIEVDTKKLSDLLQKRNEAIREFIRKAGTINTTESE